MKHKSTEPTPLKSFPVFAFFRVIGSILGGILIFLSFLAFFSARWYVATYGQLGFDSVLYTLLSDLSGLEPQLMEAYLKQALLPSVLCSVPACLLLLVQTKRTLLLVLFKKVRIRIFPLRRWVAFLLSAVLTVGLLAKAAVDVELVSYLTFYLQQSSIYHEEYRDPNTVNIAFPEQKRNLIYIFLESMEASFFSREQGGMLDTNVIPELYALAEENVNFSNNDSVGGFGYISGAAWTVGAMVSQTSGVPLKTPPGVGGNDYGADGSFLPGVTSITNILRDNGYYQTLMVGSDASFGGRKQYFQQHGIDRIYDIHSFWEDGIVPDGRYVWWGAEDAYLYTYAKQELTKIAAQEQPFAFTMLTVDTHHIGGYVCDYCTKDRAEQYENVYACASRQAAEFVAWIQQQDFYENTTIVIAGDHWSMDGDYFTRNAPEDYVRTTYNCIINPAAEAVNTKNRGCCALDLFPTTLAAMGCNIEGDRLGLGTNLFSDTPTLVETMGLENLNKELTKSSPYYTSHFFFAS